MQLVQTVVPTQEPISLSEAKDFLRVLDNDSDALISSLIVAVREHVENVTNRQLESATFELYTDDFVSKLPKNPIQTVDKIEYLDESGNYQTLNSVNYYVYENNGISYIKYIELISSTFPSLQDHKKAVKITFTAGYETVPEAVKQYIKVKISTLFENREQYVIGASISDFGNKFIENLLTPYRVRTV